MTGKPTLTQVLSDLTEGQAINLGAVGFVAVYELVLDRDIAECECERLSVVCARQFLL